MCKIYVFKCGCRLSECVKVDVSNLNMGTAQFMRFCPVHYNAATKRYSRKNVFCSLLRIEMPCAVCGKPARIKNQHADNRNALALCESHQHLRGQIKNSIVQEERRRDEPLPQTAHVNCIRCGRKTRAYSRYGFSTKTPRVYCPRCRTATGEIDDRSAYSGFDGAKQLGEAV